MNENSDPNIGPLYPKKADPGTNHADGADWRENGNSHSHFQNRGSAASRETAGGSGFDFLAVVDLVAHRWFWLLLGATLGVAGFVCLGVLFIGPKYTATVQLLRYDTPGKDYFMQTPPLSSDTFAALVAAPELLKKVGQQANPPIPPDKMRKQVKVDPQPDSDVVQLNVAATTKEEAVKLANYYAEQAVIYTRDLQAKQAGELATDYLKKQVAEMDKDIMVLHDQFVGLPATTEVSNKLDQINGNLNELGQQLAASPRPTILIAKLTQKLQTAMAELSDLTVKYTDAYPKVQQKRAQVQELQKQIQEATTNSALAASFTSAGLGGNTQISPDGQVMNPESDIIKTKLRSLEDARIQLANREREAELYAANPPGVVRVLSPATEKSAKASKRWLKVAVVTIFGGCFGFGCSLMMVLFVEMMDSRLKTPDDVKRVTRLPVLTALGDLNRMREKAQTQWAFRTWTLLQGRLSPSANHGLVCGITSSTEGEGRSTWIKLLSEAASLSGFRVLTIATKPSPMHAQSPDHQITEETLKAHSEMNASAPRNGKNHGNDFDEPNLTPSANGDSSSAVSKNNVLASPSQVTEQLTNPNSPPVVHIPLPGWVWNLERRKEWRNALNHWREIENLVIFVELPPASVPESVLLGSHLPNLLWLTKSGAAEAGETREQLETLRNARCNLVGAVLNCEPSRSIRRLLPRWLGCFAMFTALGLAAAHGQTTTQPDETTAKVVPAVQSSEDAQPQTATNLSFSVVSPSQREPWQNHLTLGPGDVLTFSIFGDPTLTQKEVPIGPDGRVSFLEADDVLAAGLTVDQLRDKINQELGKYRRAPHAIVTPVEYRSKKYYVLGQVVQRGVYILNQPITLIEALARAHGIENGQVENETVDLADLNHSFIMRRGKRLPVDLEKLLRGGDLSQNVEIAPGDYLYFASASVDRIYVLGEVRLPGMATYRPDMTVLKAISERGGFTQAAFHERVLVIRGSLSHPQTFVVDTSATTSGRTPDFKLEPKDIVYVNYRPWYRAQDLLDLATTAFVQSIVTTWTGTSVIKP